MDMNKLMQQAQQMQKKMAEVQDGLAEKTIDAESGGGMVKVVFNGRQELVSLSIDPSVINPEEADLLEDLLLAALQEGHKKSTRMAQEEMGQIAGGMGLPPGLF